VTRLVTTIGATGFTLSGVGAATEMAAKPKIESARKKAMRFILIILGFG